MTLRQVFGALLLFIPFAIVTGFLWAILGWEGTFVIYCATASMTWMIVAGLCLLRSD